jgi:RNA polymerase sigma-70 factor (ECF subfamily)
MNEPENNDSIYNTRWSLINQARDMNPKVAEKAINSVISQYLPCIFGVIRRNGINPDDCQDVCQEYLAYVFVNQIIPLADPNRGRFRSFLFSTLRNFINSYWREHNTIKRGHNVTGYIEEITPQQEAEDSLSVTPRMILAFDLDFAWGIHEEVLKSLHLEYASRNQSAVFEALSPYILDKQSGLSTKVAANLNLQEVAVRRALSRLIKRYGERFRLKVAKISNEDEDPKQEMSELLKLVVARIMILGSESREVGSAPLRSDGAGGDCAAAQP